MRAYLGLDVGAVSTNLALLDESLSVIEDVYLRTEADPILSILRILEVASRHLDSIEIAGCGTTGTGRHLAAALVGADIIRNEITAHARAALHFFPDVRTIIEIGGQDSKIILVNDGMVVDFALNTMCAAGTGSFLDYQASRMGLSVEEFAEMAFRAKESVRISGRCTVFAETDMIQKQQAGVSKEAIARGLCEALVRNYLSNVARGKRIEAPVVFQGGVASNLAVRRALEEELGTELLISQYHRVMGAIGAAIEASSVVPKDARTSFRGRAISLNDISRSSFECDQCPNCCEIVEISIKGKLVSRLGSRCGRWDRIE